MANNKLTKAEIIDNIQTKLDLNRPDVHCVVDEFLRKLNVVWKRIELLNCVDLVRLKFEPEKAVKELAILKLGRSSQLKHMA